MTKRIGIHHGTTGGASNAIEWARDNVANTLHNSVTRLIAIVIAACELRLQANCYRLIRGAGLP
jgi:hypothetical protein